MRFPTWITTDNSHGRIVSAGNPTYCHIRGWDAGVRVNAARDGESFGVYMTDGSNGYADIHVGDVRLSADGPEWVPQGSRRQFTPDSDRHWRGNRGRELLHG